MPGWTCIVKDPQECSQLLRSFGEGDLQGKEHRETRPLSIFNNINSGSVSTLLLNGIRSSGNNLTCEPVLMHRIGQHLCAIPNNDLPTIPVFCIGNLVFDILARSGMGQFYATTIVIAKDLYIN